MPQLAICRSGPPSSRSSLLWVYLVGIRRRILGKDKKISLRFLIPLIILFWALCSFLLCPHYRPSCLFHLRPPSYSSRRQLSLRLFPFPFFSVNSSPSFSLCSFNCTMSSTFLFSHLIGTSKTVGGSSFVSNKSGGRGKRGHKSRWQAQYTFSVGLNWKEAPDSFVHTEHPKFTSFSYLFFRW